MQYKGYTVKFFARSFDCRLYELSRDFYIAVGADCVRLTDTSADGYFYEMLADTNCDIAINVDEDCFLANCEAVMDLLDVLIEGGYANIGCPDGGGNAPRHGNPLVTNPFFNVFNLRLIRSRFDQSHGARHTVRLIREAVAAYDYQQDKERLMAAYPAERLETKYDFDNKSYVEPYYPFFLWLAGNYPAAYLPTQRHSDGFSTLLYDNHGRLLCAHSWFARYYSVPTWLAHTVQKQAGKQQQRIDALIDETHRLSGTERHRETFAMTLRYSFDKLCRWCIKVPQRIAGWPRKIQKRLSGKARWEL